jgi:hypothetical protein
MKKLLILTLLFICVSCSEKPSKNINLVCDGNYKKDNSKHIFTLHINNEQGTEVLLGEEDNIKCSWGDTSIVCKDINSTIKIDRYSLIFDITCCDNLKEDLSSNGKCKLVEKQI